MRVPRRSYRVRLRFISVGAESGSPEAGYFFLFTYLLIERSYRVEIGYSSKLRTPRLVSYRMTTCSPRLDAKRSFASGLWSKNSPTARSVFERLYGSGIALRSRLGPLRSSSWRFSSSTVYKNSTFMEVLWLGS